MSTDRPAGHRLVPRLSNLMQRVAVLSVLVGSFALPASSAWAAPFCDPHQITPCPTPKFPPPPPPPPPPTISPAPGNGYPQIQIPPPRQLVSNGSFEQTDAAGLTPVGWSIPSYTCPTVFGFPCSVTSAEDVSNNPWDANNTSIPIVHQCGTRSLHLTEAYSGGDWPSASQQVTILSSANALSLDFWVMFPRNSLTGASIQGETDYLYVRLGGTTIALNTNGSGDPTRGTWTHVGPLALDPTAFRGRTVSLELAAQTASAGAGFDPGWAGHGYGFFIDAMSLQSSTIGLAIPSPAC